MSGTLVTYTFAVRNLGRATATHVRFAAALQGLANVSALALDGRCTIGYPSACVDPDPSRGRSPVARRSRSAPASMPATASFA